MRGSASSSAATTADVVRNNNTNNNNRVNIQPSSDARKIHLPTFVALLVDVAEEGCDIIREVTSKGDLAVKDKGGSETLDKKYIMDAQTEADRQVEIMALRRITTFAGGRLRVVGEESYENALEGEAECDDSTCFASFDEEEEMMRKEEGNHYVDKDILKEVLEAKWPPAIASGEIDISRVNVYVDPLDGTNEYANGERPAVTVLLGVAVDGGQLPDNFKTISKIYI